MSYVGPVPQRNYREIPLNNPDAVYGDRKESWAPEVHRETQGGISGDKTGSQSIVVSGGYPADEDFGDVIVYTDQGGRDQSTGKPITDLPRQTQFGKLFAII